MSIGLLSFLSRALKINDFFSIFKNKTNKNGVSESLLPEIKISIVAPSGFGKTTLLSSIMEELEVGLSKNIAVKPRDEADERRLNGFNKKLDEIIQAKIATSSIASFDSIEGTGDSHNFNFDIILSNGKEKIIQPFSFMDIPGGWINPNNRTSEDVKRKWAEFEEHLKESLVLWIPIDSGVLCEPITQEEKSISSQLLDTRDIQELAVKWGNSMASYDGACVCYIPVKCEKYLSKDTTKNHDGPGKLKNKFDEIYSGVINKIKKINEKSAYGGIKQYYIPVETIGCITLAYSNWGNSQFNAQYRVDGNCRKLKNVDKLLKVIYNIAYKQINELAGKSHYEINQLEKGSFITKLSNRKLIKEKKEELNRIEKTLAPIVVEFFRFSSTYIEEI